MTTVNAENMAAQLNIASEVKEFQRLHFHRHSVAEENRERENQAATQIQSWFRACKVRAYLRHLHNKAVIIQKIWRGFTARARFRKMVKAEYFIMKMNFYAEMAVRIQRRWRGFYARKNLHNFYARKNYLEGLSVKSKFVRRELDEFEELQNRETDCLERLKQQTDKVYQAHRYHHLISTQQRPGVFNSPFKSAPQEMELLLRQVKYQAPTKMAPGDEAGLPGMVAPIAPSFPALLGSQGYTARACCSLRPKLPPIASKKEQGSFQIREPGEVWEQRLHFPELSLHLQTSYTHLEDVQNELRHFKSARLYSGTDHQREEQGGCVTVCDTASIPIFSQAIPRPPRGDKAGHLQPL